LNKVIKPINVNRKQSALLIDHAEKREIKSDGDGMKKIRRWPDWSVVTRRLRRHKNLTQFVDEIRRRRGLKCTINKNLEL